MHSKIHTPMQVSENVLLYLLWNYHTHKLSKKINHFTDYFHFKDVFFFAFNRSFFIFPMKFFSLDFFFNSWYKETRRKSNLLVRRSKMKYNKIFINARRKSEKEKKRDFLLGDYFPLLFLRHDGIIHVCCCCYCCLLKFHVSTIFLCVLFFYGRPHDFQNKASKYTHIHWRAHTIFFVLIIQVKVIKSAKI